MLWHGAQEMVNCLTVRESGRCSVLLVNIAATDCACVTSVKHSKGNRLTKIKQTLCKRVSPRRGLVHSYGGHLVWEAGCEAHKESWCADANRTDKYWNYVFT
jgi:hypothetical protein